MRSRRLMLLVALSAIAIAVLSAPAFSQGIGGANVSIAGVSLPESVGINSPLAVFVTLQNTGGMAAGNITLEMKLAGSSSMVERYGVRPLSPQQNESVVLLVYNSTSQAGPHTVIVSASYASNGSTFITAQRTLGYNVVNTMDQQAKSPSAKGSNGLSIAYMPLYVSLFEGSSSVYRLGLMNTGHSPESVSIGTNSSYSGIIEFSTDSLYLLPNSTLYVQFLLNAINISTNASTYYIPISLNTSYSNGTSSTATEVLALTIYNYSREQPALLSDITSLNSSSSISGTISIYSGTNGSLSDATLVTYIPANATYNYPAIKTYGLNANVTRESNSYMIKWSIPYLPAGQVTYGYYQINTSRSTGFIMNVHNVLSMPSMLKPMNILKIVDFSLPTFYTHSMENISVSALYTGTSPQYVYFYITAPTGATVLNPTQTVLATPNELISRDFSIETSNTLGTMIFTLYANTQGANVTYSLPVIVLQGQGNSTMVGQAAAAFPLNFNIESKEAKTYLIALGAVLVIVLLTYGAIITANRSKYNANRARSLKSIKEQVNE
ncbi:MAG: hypothetical protein KGI06_05545 [Candidatus Micrarchaeota archaeon]|nr:hypothetical protein [Candidatus Micrarchaeota archaeon]